MSRRLTFGLLLFFLAVGGAALLATRVVRSEAQPAEAKKLYAAVQAQLDAFRASDFQGAYRDSAAVVRQKFSLAQFEQMVRSDYASMTQAKRVEFGAVSVAGATALAQAFLTAADGSVHGYVYSFTAERDGWKIDGVESLGEQPMRRLPGLNV